jgi:hypothetical protein
MRLEDLIFLLVLDEIGCNSAHLVVGEFDRGCNSTRLVVDEQDSAERPDFLDLRRRRFRDDRSRRNSDGTSCGSSYLPRSPCPIISRVASHNDALEGILVFVARRADICRLRMLAMPFILLIEDWQLCSAKSMSVSLELLVFFANASLLRCGK